MKEDRLCWKGRFYAPETSRRKVMSSEHNSKVAGHCGRDRTLELVTIGQGCKTI